MAKNFLVTHLYPDELNLYGDTGNVLFAKNLLELLGYKVLIDFVGIGNSISPKTDFLFAGGGPDALQEKIYDDFISRKDTIEKYINSGKPSLFICGSYQLLGNYYLTADKNKIPGLGIFDFYTFSPNNQHTRIVGNSVCDPTASVKNASVYKNSIVGFQNHNGRTVFGKKYEPLAYTNSFNLGNNTEDNYEGLLYKKTVCTYLHGPILVKNPDISLFLFSKYLKSNKFDFKNLYSSSLSNAHLSKKFLQ